MMALNYSLKNLVPATVQHILIDITLLIFLLKDIIIYRIRPGKHKKTRHVALDDSIHTAKNYRKHIYFVFKLGEPALLGSKMIAYEYARTLRYLWHMKKI